jgi:hypothetical protein
MLPAQIGSLAQLAQLAPAFTKFAVRAMSQIKRLGGLAGGFCRVVATLGIFFGAAS